MGTHLITYDLHKVRNYDALYAGLQKAGAVRLALSVWGLNTSWGAGQVRQWVAQLVDNDDTVVVVQLKPTLEWSTEKASAAANQWLTSNVKLYPVKAA